MTPSLNKCPRCGTLRPSGEVAHTCVVRSTVPDHEAWRVWCAHAVANRWQTMEGGAAELARAYLDLVTQNETSRKAHTETMGWLMKIGVVLGWKLGEPLPDLHKRASDLMARKQRAVEFLQIIANWERTFDDPGAQAMADRIDAFLAERGEV